MPRSVRTHSLTPPHGSCNQTLLHPGSWAWEKSDAHAAEKGADLHPSQVLPNCLFPSFPVHFYKSSSGMPPPSPAAGFGGVTCDPWQMVRGLPPLPQELLQPAICQAAQISPVLPGSCRAASSPWDPGCCLLCLYRGYRQDLGGGSGGPATARSWWLSCLLPTQIMPEHGGAGWDPSASGSSWVGLASSGSDGVGRGLLPSVGHRLPGPAWGAVNGLRWGPVWGSCCQAVCPAAQGGSGFVPPERSAGKSTWSPEQPQLGVWGWGVSGDPQPPERAQLGEDGGCTYHKP